MAPPFPTGPRWRLSPALVACILCLAACSSEPLGPLLVTTPEGGVEVWDRQGVATPLEEGQAGRQGVQPTWSPDGKFAVWTLIDQAAGGAAVKMGDPDNQRQIDAGTAPFFYHFSPDGRKVAYLGTAPDGQGIALGLIDVAAGEAELVDGGAPYYLDWSPGGERLFIHVANQVLAFLDLDGNRSVLELQPGLFQAPQVLTDGRILIIDAGPPQSLVLLDPEGANPKALVELEGLAMFTAVEGKVAFIDTPREAAPGRLSVTDLQGEQPMVVGRSGVVAMEWSPSGERLLFLTIEDQELVPQVWDGSATVRYPGFVPSPTFVTQYLPFWDQYLRALSLWSPASDAFALPTDEEILIQDLGQDSPVGVGPGAFASWNPGSE